MIWLFVLGCLTYCFTVALTAKYKEESVELRELRIKDKEDFDKELLGILAENERQRDKIEYLKERLHGNANYND